MSWLLVVFILFVALSPLITMMPTRAQKQLANLRQAAIESGLQVQLQRPPGSPESERMMACYGLRLGHRQKLTQTGKYRRQGVDWQNMDLRGPALPETITAQFPEGVTHLVLAPDGVHIFWDELDGETHLDQIRQGLEQVREACLQS